MKKLLHNKRITKQKEQQILVMKNRQKLCDICKTTTNTWLETAEGNVFCSQNCYEVIWPNCVNCNMKMHGWITHDNEFYCSNQCLCSVTEKISTTAVDHVSFTMKKSLY